MRKRIPRKRKMGKSFRRRMMKRGPRINRQVGFPKSKVYRLRYADQFSLTTPGVVNAFVEFRYSCINLFDPQVNLGGHQPLGYDQLALLYNRNVVIGSRIAVQALTLATTAPMVWGVYVRDSAVTSTANYSGLIEQGKTQYRYAQGSLVGNAPRPIRQTFSTKKWFGLANLKDNLDLVGAQFGAPPVEDAHFLIWLGTPLGSAATFTFQVSIDYFVVVSEPKELVQS